MTQYEMFCPICGTKVTMPIGTKVKCYGVNCDAYLTLIEQYHAGGFQVIVRFES